MFPTTHSGHFQGLSDSRKAALCILEEAKAKIEQEAGANDLMAHAAQEPLRLLQESIERPRDWCPVLFGPGAIKVDEVCCCAWCSYDEPVSDPFEGA